MAMELDYDYLAKLVERTQMGDSDAFAELYTATYQKQYRFAYQYTKDSYLAQDILQDVYILVLKNIHTLKNPRLFVSWLHQITFRICFDTTQKMKRRNRIFSSIHLMKKFPIIVVSITAQSPIRKNTHLPKTHNSN